MSESKDYVLDTMRQYGAISATDLREKAAAGSVTDTQIIDREGFIPDWTARDYMTVPIGSPFRHEGQVYALVQQHDATPHPNWNPVDYASGWRVLHTKDPAKAKPYLEQLGTRNLYQKDECMIWTDGLVYRSLIDNNSWTPEGYAQGWKAVG